MAEAPRPAAVPGPPPAQGLYDPGHEHDACGDGFVVDIKGRRSHSIVEEEGQRLLGWREVPTDDRLIGASALSVEPHIMQVFVGHGPAVRDHRHFERKLYVIRKLFEKAVAALDIPENKYAYIPSLSSNTLIYKGMLSADQIETMFPDLTDPDF